MLLSGARTTIRGGFLSPTMREVKPPRSYSPGCTACRSYGRHVRRNPSFLALVLQQLLSACNRCVFLRKRPQEFYPCDGWSGHQITDSLTPSLTFHFHCSASCWQGADRKIMPEEPCPALRRRYNRKRFAATFLNGGPPLLACGFSLFQHVPPPLAASPDPSAPPTTIRKSVTSSLLCCAIQYIRLQLLSYEEAAGGSSLRRSRRKLRQPGTVLTITSSLFSQFDHAEQNSPAGAQITCQVCPLCGASLASRLTSL